MHARIEPEQLDVAVRGRDQSEGKRDRRRLATAVRAEEAEHAPAVDLDVEPVERESLPVAL
jgi:hypothetical protein